MSASVGQKLRQRRQEKELSLEKVARDTYIRLHYLQALEAGKLDALPSLTQARGFLRTYASYLGLDAASLLEELTAPARPAPSPSSAPLPSPAPPAPQEQESRFVEVGQALRRQRELLGISLEDAERQTHIRRHYLQALEAGKLSALPSPVQGRGMLSNYAAFLGLDSDRLLLKFAEGLQAELAARKGRLPPASPPRQRGLPLSLRRLLSADLIFGIVVVLLLVAVVWGALRVSSAQADRREQPTPPSIAEMLLPSPTFTLTPTPSLATPTLPPDIQQEIEDQAGAAAVEFTSTPEILLPALSEELVQLYLVARQRAWMRVTADGEVVFEGRVIPGNAYEFSAKENIELLTGSGSALQVFFNGQDLGVLGLFGEVVSRVFTPGGILIPTPTVTATPLPSPTPTATSSP